MIKKLFSLAAAVLVCAGVWATTINLKTSSTTIDNKKWGALNGAYISRNGGGITIGSNGIPMGSGNTYIVFQVAAASTIEAKLVNISTSEYKDKIISCGKVTETQWNAITSAQTGNTQYQLSISNGDKVGDETFTLAKNAKDATTSCSFSADAAGYYAIYWANSVNNNVCLYEIEITSTSSDPVCPAGLSISGAQEVIVGKQISLTASLTAGNGDISYQWYKGGTAEANKIAGATAKTFAIATCAYEDAGNYYCVASKADCDDVANAEAYAVTVVEDPTGTINDLVVISENFTFTPSATNPSNYLMEGKKLISLGETDYVENKGMRVKNNRQLAFKVAANAEIKVTFSTNGDREIYIGTTSAGKELANSASSPIEAFYGTGGIVYLSASSDLYFTKLEISFCEAPAKALSLSSNAAGTVYVGDEITFATDGGNGGTVTIAGAAEETITDGKWTATLGEHTFVATQAKNGNYCAQESEALVLNVIQKTPVTAVSVAGETNTYIGDILTYTATAANATAYEWYINDEKQGSDSAKLVVTAAKGSYSIVCKARNAFNAEDEWIASEAIELTVSKGAGVLITYTAVQANTNTANIAADANNLIGGKAEQKTQSNAKINSGGYYKLTLAKGAFIAGDTVRIIVKPEGDKFSVPATMILSSRQDNTDIIGQVEGLSATSSDNITADIVLTKGASTIWLSRDETITKQNPIVVSISVIRPKDVKSTAEALTAVSVNSNAISAAQLTSLLADESLAIEDDYLNAPTIVFTKTITTTYDDDSQSAKNVEIEVEAEEVTGKWQAQAKINDVTYTVTTAKTASYTVTYKCGEETLGTELVISNGHPTDYAKYQTLAQSTFNGWYSDATLETAVADMSAEVISSATTYYADITYSHAQSINIEQIVLDNNKKYDVMAQMGGLGYESNIDNSLDSLDNSKTKRNYPYLGLKIKAAGKLLNFRIAKGSTVKVKFGNVGATPLVSLNGSEYAAMELSEGVYTYTATAETLISIKTASDATLVFKQIMIDEELKEVVLPALYTVTYNAGAGECEVVKAETQFAGDKITLPTVVAPENYTFDGWYDAETEGNKIGGVGAEYAPEANITLYAYYTPAGGGSAINNTDAAVKTAKVIRNGQLIIIRDGKEFNVLGTAVK